MHYDEVYSPHRQNTTDSDRQTDRQTDTIKPSEKRKLKLGLKLTVHNVIKMTKYIRLHKHQRHTPTSVLKVHINSRNTLDLLYSE